MKVDNLLLQEKLGEGSFGEVYLSNYTGSDKKYATKIYDRKKIEDSPKLLKYFNCEINFLSYFNHPNIVKFIEAKKTRKHFYIITEFCNGGELEMALEKYKLKYGKPFSEEIVQHLMRQIMSAFNYLHNSGIMHRDIKLQNILLHFDSEDDKNNLNMMKAIPKVIDFGFAIHLNENQETGTLVGNKLNMDPLLLKKCSFPNLRNSTYNIKTDIWSLGSICYEMIIGKFAFDSEDMDDLVYKVEKGDYEVPSYLSEEIVSFINGMLQYDAEKRLTCAQLVKHRFLTQNVNSFHKIPLNKVSNKMKGDNKIIINVKKNNTIWAIFNEKDEAKLVNVDSGENLRRLNTQKTPEKINNQPSLIQQPQEPIKQVQSFEMKVNPFFMNNNINNNQNSEPVLPSHNPNPIHVNQKFDVEYDYVYSGNIYFKD